MDQFLVYTCTANDGMAFHDKYNLSHITSSVPWVDCSGSFWDAIEDYG